jgi:hypothetical protein
MVLDAHMRRSGRRLPFALAEHPESTYQHGTARDLQVTPA